MNIVENKGINLVSLIIITVFIILAITLIIVLVNSGDNKAITTATEGLEEIPYSKGQSFRLLGDYCTVIQTGDKELYISQKNDVNIGNNLVLQKDLFYKVQKCKEKAISIIDVLLDTGYRAWFIAYENGTVERIDLIEDASKIKESLFIITSVPLPKHKDITSLYSIGNEISGIDSDGNTFSICNKNSL